MQSGICKVAPVRAMQACRGVEVQLHTLNLNTTLNQHEWPASCKATPMPTKQEAGWEPEMAWVLWSKEKSLPLPGIKL